MTDKPVLKLVRLVSIYPIHFDGFVFRQIYYEVVLNNVSICSHGFKIGYEERIGDHLDPDEALALIANLEAALKVKAKREQVRTQPN